MCYAGGPRCYGDAKKDYDKALEKLNSFKEEHGTEEEIYAKGFGILKTYRALNKDVSEKRVDLQQTKQFVEDLAEALDSGSVSGQLEETVIKTMHDSKAGYDAQLLAFDQRNNTVLGRGPSKFGTAEGIQHLAKKVRSTQDKSPKEQAAALKAYEHAVATRERVLNGDIKLPTDYEPWQKPQSATSLPTGDLKAQLETAEWGHRLALRGLQHMMRDNAKNPFSIRHRTALAIREAEIAEQAEKVQQIKEAMRITSGTKNYGTHQQAYGTYSENNKKLQALQARIQEYKQSGDAEAKLGGLFAERDKLVVQQKELATFLNSAMPTQ